MQIEIREVHPPSPGKRTGTVVTTDGQRFMCWPDKLAGLAPGHAYEVKIEEREHEGRMFRKIVSHKAVDTLFSQPVQGAAGGTVAAGPGHGVGNGARKPVDPLEVQFVTEMLKLMGPLPAASIALAARDMRDVYRRTFVEG